jgi:hypothetical protein
MKSGRSIVAVFTAVLGVSLLVMAVSAQRPEQLPGAREPFGNAGEAIYPAFEGWGASQDNDSLVIVLGYMNRNRAQVVEIPVGPNNRIEPGGPDYGQPTIFEPGRQTAVFAIKVPKDFGAQKLTWTLVANGQPAVVTFHLHRDYYLNFYKDEANGNEPPQMKFGSNERMMAGPHAGIAQTLTGSVGQPVPLKLWASDPPPLEKNWETIVSAQNRPAPRPVPPEQAAIVNGQVFGRAGGAGGRGNSAEARPDLTVTWTKMRGPGTVTVTPSRVPLTTNGDRNRVVEANAVATFSAPGEYLLRAQPIEPPDAGDGLCCFTFANVRVIVK